MTDKTYLNEALFVKGVSVIKQNINMEIFYFIKNYNFIDEHTIFVKTKTPSLTKYVYKKPNM
jgi:hypothetical protein